MPFVLDASIAACWAFEDEDHPRAALALERIRTDEARVPGLWWFYLELARRDGLPLATLDADLARAARAEDLALIDETPC